MDLTGSETCPMAGFGIGKVEFAGSVTRLLFTHFVLHSSFNEISRESSQLLEPG
jgi:hypothetical protein